MTRHRWTPVNRAVCIVRVFFVYCILKRTKPVLLQSESPRVHLQTGNFRFSFAMNDNTIRPDSLAFSSEERKSLLAVALRFQALFVDVDRKDLSCAPEISPDVSAFLLSLSDKGYVVEEDLLRALCIAGSAPGVLEEITQVIDKALGIGLNWAPLVKGWNIPTGESFIDHYITIYANYFLNLSAGRPVTGPMDMPLQIPDKDQAPVRATVMEMIGTILPCGHFIPDGTFPLERYNGCPFCGTPFETSENIFKGQGRKKKSLRLMTKKDMEALRDSLMASSVPLDATQIESLKTLINVLGTGDTSVIAMKETAMVVVDSLLEKAKSLEDRLGKEEKDIFLTEAGRLFSSPADILRFLWFKKTGRLQVIEPKTLVMHAGKLSSHMVPEQDKSSSAAMQKKQELKLKYDRRMCRSVALWLNGLDMDAEAACEIMHPKRGMWVRMIHSLRLGEYSRKPGFERLAKLLDVFYKNDYSVWKGELDKCLGINCGCVDYGRALELLKQRPGSFARNLFAVMLRMGPKPALDAFRQIMDKVPRRLILSLGNAAELFFDTNATRIARPLTGVTKTIPYNKKLDNYTPEQRESMTKAVNDLYKETMLNHFSKDISAKGKKMFIDPALFDIPVSIGDRSSTIQDTSAALQGTRFKVEGDSVRLFMQWGKGLPAQHLDMDLSSAVCYQDGRKEYCAYFNLTLPGARHSGDIRNIPDKKGTAEYVELNIPELQASGAKYVLFSCNAYSEGSISPNLMVGWMDSANPMKISDKTGVAYDPSTVQHIVRISESNLSKGLIFGLLDIEQREITWLEMSFNAQLVAQLNTEAVEALLKRLKNKLSVGELLQVKAQAQQCVLTSSPDEADKDLCYTYQWALDAAAVSKLLFQ